MLWPFQNLYETILISKEEIEKNKILCRIKKVIKKETNTTIVKNL